MTTVRTLDGRIVGGLSDLCDDHAADLTHVTAGLIALDDAALGRWFRAALRQRRRLCIDSCGRSVPEGPR